MFELFLGNYKEVVGTIIYYKENNKYIPCVVTNYYFKSRKYTIVPVEDIANISNEECSKRRCFFTNKIYIRRAF